MYDLSEKIAVVTGASRGIGLHIARAFAAAGARVAVTGRSMARLEPATESIGGDCLPVVCDQADPRAVEALARTVEETWGAPDILVNNAGGGGGGPVPTMSLEAWQQVIATNLTGVFYTTRCFLPGMLRKERGDIFIISSMNGKKADPGSAAYSASKFGLHGFAQALLYDRAPLRHPRHGDQPEPDRYRRRHHPAARPRHLPARRRHRRHHRAPRPPPRPHPGPRPRHLGHQPLPTVNTYRPLGRIIAHARTTDEPHAPTCLSRMEVSQNALLARFADQGA